MNLELCLAALNFHPVYAGPAIRFRRYLPELEERGVSVRIFCGTPEAAKAGASEIVPDWQGRAPGDSLPLEEVEGVPLRRVRLHDAGSRRRNLQFGRALAGHLSNGRRPDVVQLLFCGFDALPLLYRLRRLRVPTVYTATMVPDLEDRNPLKRRLLQRYIAWPQNLVDAVVVSSEAMKRKLQMVGVRSPLHVIPNGVDVRRFRPGTHDEALAVRRSLGIEEGKTILLFLGPISPRKGIDLLLEAWGRLAPRRPDLHLVLAGPRMDLNRPEFAAFGRALDRLVHESGASERVHFTGLVDEPEAYLRAADLFVFPSRREGMPNVVPEAMASGLPAVLTPFVGLPAEFGQAGEHYLLADFDAGILAERIERLLADRPLRNRMGEAARRWVERHLEVGRSVERYVDLYRALAGRVGVKAGGS